MHCAYLLRNDYGKGGFWRVKSMSNRRGRGASLAKCKAFVVEIGTAPSIYNSPYICYYVHRHRSTLFAREKCWRMGGEVNNH